MDRVYCPLLKKEISIEQCFDVCMYAEGLAPARFLPKNIQPSEETKEICNNCENHRDD